MNTQILCFMSNFLSNISNSPQGERENEISDGDRRHQADSALGSWLQLEPRPDSLLRTQAALGSNLSSAT